MPPKVLIVDDDRIILFLHQIIIKESGISTTPLLFGNGQEAFNYLQSELPGKDAIIFLDLNMPVMDGWELLDALYQPPYLNHIQVVLVTSSIDPKDREKAKKYPMVKLYLEKPMDIEACKKAMLATSYNNKI